MSFDLLTELRLALDTFLDIRIPDVVDIALVTALLYTAVALVRRTQARLVALGILTFGALYIAARVFDLRLTSWILQGFFAVLVIVLVVVFQEELRQLFERVALWGRRRQVPLPEHSATVDILVGCAADFARARIGALVVLPGRQPVERQIRGGCELDGQISEPLLKSLFDPHSPGHDGAVVIEGDRVARFAAHLPLSEQFQQLAHVGTRHCAALGLAERSDALCVVVSEERGRISVAREGLLRELEGPQELAAVLQEFQRTVQRPTDGRRVGRSLLRESWGEKLASLALVLALWYLFVPGSRPTTARFELPVQVINVPPGFAIEGVEPEAVTAVFSGLRRGFYLFDPSRLSVTVDASLARLGRRTFELGDDDVRHPADLKLQELSPSRVRISLREE